MQKFIRFSRWTVAALAILAALLGVLIKLAQLGIVMGWVAS